MREAQKSPPPLEAPRGGGELQNLNCINSKHWLLGFFKGTIIQLPITLQVLLYLSFKQNYIAEKNSKLNFLCTSLFVSDLKSVALSSHKLFHMNKIHIQHVIIELIISFSRQFLYFCNLSQIYFIVAIDLCAISWHLNMI